jgi:cupin 2 domain-containing protein
MTIVTNLLADLPAASQAEQTTALVFGDGVRLERIVSFGQASPEGFWYDQPEAEWVMLLAGRARLAIEGEPEARIMGPGDAIFLAAHCRHRVEWTDPDQPTVWLALFIALNLRPSDLSPSANRLPTQVDRGQ